MKKLLLIFSVLLYGCSVPNTKVLVDNSLCVNSLTLGVFETIKPDLDKNQAAEFKDNISDIERSFSREYIGCELSQFEFTAYGTRYYYLFQRNGDGCFIKLYKKKQTGYLYENTITFINTAEINGCKCGKNDYQIQLVP